MPKENISLRSHIKSCFSDLQCYLMPHPGLTVANSPTFNGRLADIDPTFVKQLQDYVPHILSPLNLTVKSINGQAVTCCELMEYFRAYVKIFQSGELPQPVSMYAATAEVNNLNACNRSRSLYVQEMNMVSFLFLNAFLTDVVWDHEFESKAMVLSNAWWNACFCQCMQRLAFWSEGHWVWFVWV